MPRQKDQCILLWDASAGVFPFDAYRHFQVFLKFFHQHVAGIRILVLKKGKRQVWTKKSSLRILLPYVNLSLKNMIQKIGQAYETEIEVVTPSWLRRTQLKVTKPMWAIGPNRDRSTRDQDHQKKGNNVGRNGAPRQSHGKPCPTRRLLNQWIDPYFLLHDGRRFVSFGANASA